MGSLTTIYLTPLINYEEKNIKANILNAEVFEIGIKCH
jgi:hypothetical protein